MKKTFAHKQPVLKPQDLVTVAKLALVKDGQTPTYVDLSRALKMSASEIHASVKRAAISGFLQHDFDRLAVNFTAFIEFIAHGVAYVFPPLFTEPTRGMVTSVSAAPLASSFDQTSNTIPIIWPHAEGKVWGLALCPLYPSVPAACMVDEPLYRMLSLIDAVRSGAAREREIALEHLERAIR